MREDAMLDRISKTSRRDVLKGGGALVVSFSLAGKLDPALAHGDTTGGRWT